MATPVCIPARAPWTTGPHDRTTEATCRMLEIPVPKRAAAMLREAVTAKRETFLHRAIVCLVAIVEAQTDLRERDAKVRATRTLEAIASLRSVLDDMATALDGLT